MVVTFLKEFFPSWNVRPVSARRDNSTWLVEIDVGVFYPRIDQVKLDGEPGHIIEYEFPRPERPRP